MSVLCVSVLCVSVVRFKFRFDVLISGKISKETPGSVASGTLCIFYSLLGCIITLYMFKYSHAPHNDVSVNDGPAYTTVVP